MTKINELTENSEITDRNLFVIYDGIRTVSVEASALKEYLSHGEVIAKDGGITFLDISHNDTFSIKVKQDTPSDYARLTFNSGDLSTNNPVFFIQDKTVAFGLDSIVSMLGSTVIHNPVFPVLPIGTKANPPQGLKDAQPWLDATDSMNDPIMRVHFPSNPTPPKGGDTDG